jgi:hypothetical protein
MTVRQSQGNPPTCRAPQAPAKISRGGRRLGAGGQPSIRKSGLTLTANLRLRATSVSKQGAQRRSKPRNLTPRCQATGGVLCWRLSLLSPARRPAGAINFGDIVRKLDVPRVECDKCGRAGRYRVDRRIERYGIDAKLFDWSDEITAESPRHVG